MGRWLEIPETANIVMQDATKGISNVCIKVYQCVLKNPLQHYYEEINISPYQ